MTRCALGFGIAAAGLLVLGCAAPPRPDGGVSRWEQARADAALAIADEQIAAGHLDQARQSLAVLKHSPDPRCQLRLARLELEHGEYEAALRRLDQLAERALPTSEAHRLRAVALEGAGRRADAAQAYAAAYDLAPSVELLIAQVETLAADEQVAPARDLLDGERGRFPGHVALQVLAARLALRATDPQAAVTDLRTAALAEPTSPEIRRLLAESLMAAGRSSESVELWRELATGSASAEERRAYQGRLAAALAASGQAQPAHELYQALLAAEANNLKLRLEMAAAALAAGRPAEALAAAQLVLSQRDDPEALLVAAISYKRLGRGDLAAAQLARIRADGPAGPLAP
ncbi:MAG: tetratricopeptide repeat protein, partial [Planctomycetota bacterium]